MYGTLYVVMSRTVRSTIRSSYVEMYWAVLHVVMPSTIRSTVRGFVLDVTRCSKGTDLDRLQDADDGVRRRIRK